MCLIDVPIFKEIKPWEGYFYAVQKFFKSDVVQKFFKSSAKKEKKYEKKIGKFLEVYILFTINTISFKFDM